MAKIFNGRYTAFPEDSFVVFIIGMRVNKIYQFWKWLPVAMEMPKMLKVLLTQKNKGLLGMESTIFWRGTALIQYWKSFDHLERFAKDKDDPHLEAWRRYNKKVGNNGSVGVFHETYKVEKGNSECIYANMPLFGLAKATKHITVKEARDTARARLNSTIE